MTRRAVLILALSATSCLSEDPAGRSAAVVLADGATGIHYTTLADRESVAYEAPLSWPAQPLIARIEQALHGAGYSRVDDPKAFRWTAYGPPEKRVDHWNGAWRSADGAKTAEYILEYRGRRDRLHVWARVGIRDEEPPQHPSAELPAEAGAPSQAIELAVNEAAVLCGAEGTGVASFTEVTSRTAAAHWQFRSPAGRNEYGMKRLEEHPGAKPGEIDGRDTHFAAGPWELTWSPGTVTRESDGRTTGVSSHLYYPSGVRARKIEAAEIPRLDLKTACR